MQTMRRRFDSYGSAASLVLRAEHKSGKKVDGFAVLFLFLIAGIIILAFSTVFPAQAHATFRDVAELSANQDLGSYGKPIKGNELPDGVYKVKARTTSYMCNLYTNPADAESHDSKEHAIISVDGGDMTAVFYASGAYNYIYLGTAEEAAAATNKAGTKSSAYIAGDPDEGSVPHLYSIPIAALNKPFDMATYNGGSNGNEEGAWYAREVVFIMTDAELQQIKGEAEEEEKAAARQEEEERKRREAEEEAAAEEAQRRQEEEARREQEAAEEEERRAREEELAAANARSSNGVVGSASQPVLTEDDTSASGDDGEESSGEEEGAGTQARSMAAPLHGVRMNIVVPQAIADTGAAQGEAAQEVEEPLLTREQAIALAVFAAFVVGVLIRCAAYRRAYEGATRLAEGPPGLPEAPDGEQR